MARIALDMDNDGFDDLVVHHDKTTGGKVTTVYFSNGNGTFAAGLDVDHGLNSATNARIADFNNDGKLDLQFHTYADGISGFSLTVMLNSGKAFAAPVTTNLGSVAVPQEGGGIPGNFPIFPVRDYDGDGVPDIIGNSSGGQVGDRPLGLTVIKGAPDGSFTFLEPSLIYNINNNATGAAIVADFNLDGKPDLLLGTNSTGSIGITTVINGAPLPPDTAGNDQNSPRLLGALTNRITVIEHVSADANADARDRFDWYRFSVDSAVTVRSAVIPLVAPVAIRTARLDGIGTGNDFPNGIEPVFLDKALTAGSWHTNTDKFSNSETDYRLDIFVPVAGPDIGVYQGLDQRVSGQGTIDYGTLFKNTTDTRHTFLVRNDGLATLNLTAIQFPAGFSIADNSLVATLAPGAHDYVTIQLDTSAVGTFNGNIVIPSNDADTPSFIIPVSATVEDQGPIPQPLIAVLQGQTTLASGQTAVSFGTATQDDPLPLQKIFTIRNDGNANLILAVPQMPSGFVLTEPLLPLTLTPNQTETFTVSVGTATAGSFGGNITFTHNSGGTQATFSIPVSATISQSNGGGGGLPDLTGEIQQVSLGKNPITPQDKLLPGDTLNTTLRIFNAGIGVLNAGNIDITFFASTDFTIDGDDIELQSFTAKNSVIAGGDHVDLNFNVLLPQNTPPGNYRLLARLDASGQIAESGEANNTAPSGTILPVVLEVGQVGSRSNVMLTLQEPDGTLVTFGLNGGGTAGISIDSETGAIDLNILEVSAKSSLTINSKPATKGGDNTVLLRNVTIAASASTQPVNASALSKGEASTEPRTAAQTSSTNPLGKLLAKTARLIGTLTAPGGLGALTLDAAEGAIIDIGAPADPKATLTLSLNLLKDVTFTSQTPVKALSVVQWLDTDETPDSFTAPSLGSLATKGNKAFQIAGDFEADLNLTGVAGPAATLGSAKIAGALASAAWAITGNAGAITVAGNTNNSSITAGTIKALTLNGGVNTLAVNLTQPYNPANTKLVNLPKLAVKGVADQFTLISTGNVGAVTFGGLINSAIYVGLAGETPSFPSAADDFLSTPGPALGKVAIIGTYTASNIAATTIASLALPEPTTANGGTPFGVASRAIQAGKIGTLKLVDADKSGSIDPLTIGNFELRIV